MEEDDDEAHHGLRHALGAVAGGPPPWNSGAEAEGDVSSDVLIIVNVGPQRSRVGF